MRKQARHAECELLHPPELALSQLTLIASYINKPDRNTITAILKTTPPSQVPGFRELIANYITGDPSPVMRSREIVST